MRELWWIPVTVAVWLAARRATRGATTPLANPTLIGVAVMGGLVLLSGVGARAYADGTAALSWFLGPAVVALAVPLHQERERLRRHARALLAGAVVGATVSALLGYGLVRLLALPSPFELALTTRSATTPISVALANGLGGLPALSAVASIWPPSKAAMFSATPRKGIWVQSRLFSAAMRSMVMWSEVPTPGVP